ncbi:MAG: hypothetical protein QXH66_02165 [Conexivisphaerales archaeon]
MGISIGVRNTVAIADTSDHGIVVRGGFLKLINNYFNNYAFLKSIDNMAINLQRGNKLLVKEIGRAKRT